MGVLVGIVQGDFEWFQETFAIVFSKKESIKQVLASVIKRKKNRMQGETCAILDESQKMDFSKKKQGQI